MRCRHHAWLCPHAHALVAGVAAGCPRAGAGTGPVPPALLLFICKSAAWLRLGCHRGYPAACGWVYADKIYHHPG